MRLSRSQTRSTSEPSLTGTLTAMPSSLPFNSGMTSPSALAAPVLVGMMFSQAALALRRSECGRSRIRWSFVYACIVVMIPRAMPNVSWSTFATGARQLVVQLAVETTL